MVKISGMTPKLSSVKEVHEKPTCRNCSYNTKLLIVAVFVLFGVCQVQILLNRERSVDVANILHQIQKANERIEEIELSLVKVENSLDVLHTEKETKTTISRQKRQSRISFRQQMRQIRRYLKQLEQRFYCALSEDGKDARGKRCPPGRVVQTGFLKNNRTYPDNPTQETTRARLQAKPSWGTMGSTESRTLKSSRSKTTYTVWGNSRCRENVKKVYSGRAATLHSSGKPSIAAEYMCIPDRIEYPKHGNITSGMYLSPVKYGGKMGIFTFFSESECQQFGPETCSNLKLKHPHLFKKLDFFQVPCVVCLRERRTTTIVMPGRDNCQSGLWQKEYLGYLMTQQGGNAGSQLICVNADANVVPFSNTTGSQGPLLQPVAYKCLGPSCPPSDTPGYKPRALPCVVCSI